MNEILPPFDPGNGPPSPVVPEPPPPRTPPSPRLCALYGVLLFIVSCGLTIVFPFASLIGLAIALVSLFFPGYRYIFVGYISTIGVLLLLMTAFCGIMFLSNK